jgi:hypothetical protein
MQKEMMQQRDFKKVDSSESKMLKQVQHDNGEGEC